MHVEGCYLQAVAISFRCRVKSYMDKFWESHKIQMGPLIPLPKVSMYSCSIIEIVIVISAVINVFTDSIISAPQLHSFAILLFSFDNHENRYEFRMLYKNIFLNLILSYFRLINLFLIP